MARMVWDDIGERFYETGVEQCALYLYDKYETDKTKCYHDGVPWNGLTGVSEKPSGAEPTDLWANDAKYLTMISAEKFAASIEAYTWPEEFNECDGIRKLANGLRFGQQQRRKFGLAYKSLIGNDEEGTDLGYKLHLMYGCLCAPSEKARKTINDSPEAMTFTWEVSTTPVPINIAGYRFKATSYLEIDSRDYTGVNKVKLQMLENILYGVEEFNNSTYANYLPLPEEVNKILSYEPEIQSIRVSTPPYKKSYKIGESLTIDGLNVVGLYSTIIGSFESLVPNEDLVCTGFDSSTVGEKTVTVTYSGKTTTFTVVVGEEPGPLKLNSIAISKQPDKTTYTVGEPFDKTGMEIDAFYSDGTVIHHITEFDVKAPETSVAGIDIPGEALYTDGDVTATAMFYITVVEPVVELKNLDDVGRSQRELASQEPTKIDAYMTYPIGVSQKEFKNLIATKGGPDYYGVNAVYTDGTVVERVNIDPDKRVDCTYYTSPTENVFDLSEAADYGKLVYLVYKDDRSKQVALEIAVANIN